MVDVATGLLLPDLGPPSRGSLLSNALLWDVLEVLDSPAPKDEEDRRILEELAASGAVALSSWRRPRSTPPPGEDLFSRASARLAEGVRGDSSVSETATKVREMFDAAAVRVADRQIEDVHEGLARCAALGLAPVSAGFFTRYSAQIPELVPAAPVQEATLLSVAVAGVAIHPETSVEALLAFKEQHRPELGRFRAAMSDLATGLTSDASSPRLLQEASATVANRVEPALGNLAAALKAGRIRFLWNAVTGITAVSLSPVVAGASVVGGAKLAATSLAYAFDRDRIVREHPFGYLHRLRSEMGTSEASGMPPRLVIADPESELRYLLRRAAAAVADWGLEQNFGFPPRTEEECEAEFARYS